MAVWRDTWLCGVTRGCVAWPLAVHFVAVTFVALCMTLGTQADGRLSALMMRLHAVNASLFAIREQNERMHQAQLPSPTTTYRLLPSTAVCYQIPPATIYYHLPQYITVYYHILPLGLYAA